METTKGLGFRDWGLCLSKVKYGKETGNYYAFQGLGLCRDMKWDNHPTMENEFEKKMANQHEIEAGIA